MALTVFTIAADATGPIAQIIRDIKGFKQAAGEPVGTMSPYGPIVEMWSKRGVLFTQTYTDSQGRSTKEQVPINAERRKIPIGRQKPLDPEDTGSWSWRVGG